MKKILRDIAAFGISLYFTSIALKGLVVSGGVEAFLIGGAALTIGEYILKPTLSIVVLPFNLLTLGAFSYLINIIILLIITRYYTAIKITEFDFPGFTILSLKIPSFHSQIILSYLLISAMIYLIYRLSIWLFSR
jgi:putative membrane protein